ncbi:hypothetical protein [Diplocloster modestus]|uniref:Uncharacterized protein n=1 Tax=Diplocloster modestus TaxID=2850322 RepID=A0ABS6K3E3_9FIRM|nr:hypothetical protein [Diplocloster modestus]MBU9725021.1 hypothetical protein [Diplocloster modestus]
MRKKIGQDQLREFTERNYRERITQVTDGVWLLMADGEDTAGVRGRKAEALRRRAEYETSANGRHYYLACARELESER